MANYVAKFRTNYFTVKDEPAFLDLMQRAGFTLENHALFSQIDQEGVKRYAFGSENGCLMEVIDPDYNIDEAPADVEMGSDELADAFILDLQTHVCDDDCIVIQSIGSEKLRYVAADITVITAQKIYFKSLREMADELVTRAMGRPFATEYDY